MSGEEEENAAELKIGDGTYPTLLVDLFFILYSLFIY